METNPGPPKRGGPGSKPKEPTKEEQMKMLQDKVINVQYILPKIKLLRKTRGFVTLMNIF